MPTPYVIVKLRNRNCYSVRKLAPKNNTRRRRRTLRVFSKCTTEEKARKQYNILNAHFYKYRV